MRPLRDSLAAALTLVAVSAMAQVSSFGPSQANLRPAPGWVVGSQVGLPADVSLDFANNRWWQKGNPRCTNAGSCLTDTRSSAATQADCNGNWTQVDAAVPRQGCGSGGSIEEGRTNSLRNNTMAGAAAGSPGTAPTDWIYTTSFGGLTGQIVGTGVESGINYIDVRYSGTTTGALLESAPLLAEFNTQVAASYGQTWTESEFAYLVGGSLANVTLKMAMVENNAAGSPQAAGGRATISAGAPPLGNNRYSGTYTLTNASTAFVNHRVFQVDAASGVPVDFTLRVGWPQLENVGINSSVASATVNAGGSAYVGVSGTMTWSGAGCATNPVLNVTTSAGAINAVTSVANAGSCTTFPSSTATTWTPGGGLSAGSGASFNLAPTNNAALAFPTTPILTTNAAVARAADNIRIANPPVFGGAYTMYASGVYATPSPTSNNQWLGLASDNTNANRLGLFRASSGTGIGFIQSAGVSIGPANFGNVPQGTFVKYAVAHAPNDSAAANGTTVNTDNTAGTPAAFTRIDIGSNLGTAFLNGPEQQFGLWPTARIPNASLLAVTR